MNQNLIISKESFNAMLLGLIQSGVTFKAVEDTDGDIHIEFLGGY